MADPAIGPTAANAAESLPDPIADTVHALAELHADHQRRAAPIQRGVDRAVKLVGRPRFVAMLSGFVTAWIALNLILGRYAFDSSPFSILQGLAQLAALYITVLILITQRHEGELTDRREQLILELALLSDQKNAKIVGLLEEMRRDSPLIKDREDLHAEALAIPADPQQVLAAIVERQDEMLALVETEIATGKLDPKAVP